MSLIDKPGCIILPVSDHPRYHEFEDSMANIQAPPGSKKLKRRSPDLVSNLNEALRVRSGNWVWFMGDDHEFAPDTLMRLLTHDVDMVAPVVYRKLIPPRSVTYRSSNIAPLEEIPLSDLPSADSGLMQISTAGMAGMLVKMEVVDRIGDPWFIAGSSVALNVPTDRTIEDLLFVDRAVRLGYKCFLDPSTVMGHTTSATLWPRYRDGKWGLEISLGRDRGSVTLVL